MRWQNLTVGSEEGDRHLPGYKDPAVVRTFDAPEALDTRFYEVTAKSALNKVPAKSRMPFGWTINPYRGCSHACVFCVGPETPILLANGRTKPIAKLEPGERIYGTGRKGSYRRYVETTVLDHWVSLKLAYRITLEDGSKLVASGDHRFLTSRGWKHVLDEPNGGRRPHLTLNSELMGTGRFAAGPDQSAEYRLGYLCGMIRGDGHVGSYAYPRPDLPPKQVHGFRLALIDLEPLARTRDYLSSLDVATNEFLFQRAGAIGSSKPVMAIRTGAAGKVARIREAIRWPSNPSDPWRKGFLAGVFDAEGGCSGGILRISNTDPKIIDQISSGLQRFGFDFAVEHPRGTNGLRVVRLRGGLRERLRFFHTVDPATTRKRTITGTALKSDSNLGVVSIEPLGKRRLYDITTGTGDFIANGVVSHNCFARPTHEYLGMNAGRDFDKEIVVKVNAPEVLRTELRRPSWKREHVALGTNTDPYQWVEGRYKLMRGIWEAMRDFRNPCSILTKSPLLLRDLDLMKEIAEVADFSACLSIPTLDEKAWRATEPHTPHPMKRIEAVAKLNAAGIPTGVLIAPLMPGINDSPKQVQRLVDLCGEAGAVSIGGVTLHLRGSVKGVFFEWLAEQRPDLQARYERLYDRRAYAPAPERKRIQEVMRDARRKSPVLRSKPRSQSRYFSWPPPKDKPAEPPPLDQTSLF